MYTVFVLTGYAHQATSTSSVTSKKNLLSESYNFLSSATPYGCQHEADAREGHKSIMLIVQYY